MKKEAIKNKKMTIDDLAIMVAKGFERVEKDITEVKKDISEVKNEITEVKKDISEVKDNLDSTRGDILAMGDRFTPSCFRPRREFANSEFHDLASRVGMLEQKVKTKR